MAITYQSIQTASATNTNAVTVTKPTSVALYELMIAVITNGGRNDPATAASLSGWTQIYNNNSVAGSFNLDVTVLAKIATTADVSASNYAFSVTNATDVVLGSIYRFSTSFATIAGTTETGSSTGVTTENTDNILIAGKAVGGGASNTLSGYAVANDNPTWTERADFGSNYDDGSSDDYLNIGMATADYDLQQATGTVTVTDTATSVLNSHIFIIALTEETQNASPTGSVGVLNLTGNLGAISNTVAGSVGTITLTGNTSTTTTTNPIWVNTPKS